MSRRGRAAGGNGGQGLLGLGPLEGCRTVSWMRAVTVAATCAPSG